MVDFAYTGEFLLRDGTLLQVDLEQPGWATKDLIANIALFTLVPKVPGTWPLLRTHIPERAKPVWTWRTFRKGNGPPEQPTREMQIYGIGFKKRGSKPHMIWVVPGGHVEAGTDAPLFADVLWANTAL